LCSIKFSVTVYVLGSALQLMAVALGSCSRIL